MSAGRAIVIGFKATVILSPFRQQCVIRWYYRYLCWVESAPEFQHTLSGRYRKSLSGSIATQKPDAWARRVYRVCYCPV